MNGKTTGRTDRPLGKRIRFCPDCGADVRSEIPAGDNRLRYCCNACATVHYENPKLVIGCVPVHNDKILLCKRAIAPRLGYWTLPAGFMELGESMEDAAARETREEACAEVRIERLLASVNVVLAGQVHVFFNARLEAPDFAAGSESLAVELVAPADIPWPELAFTSNRIALEQHLLQRAAGRGYVWTGNAL
ncbi:MAG: NUDIX hydrolase [Gammaproteobacteria bacterium]|nr:NUDIX hydrolase [Gammaproteobacteria bacterium]